MGKDIQLSLVIPFYDEEKNVAATINGLMSALDINSKDWFIDAEIMIKCRKKGYGFRELPVFSEERKECKSSVNSKTKFEFIKNIYQYW